MPMFRKKPVVIEAMQWDGSIESGTAIMDWSEGDVSFRAHLGERDSPTLFVQSPEGEHSASPGYWIIRGVQGEHYFCKPDVFAATYEPAARARLSAGVEMTDDAAVKLAQDMNVLPTRAGCAYCPTEEAVVAYSRALIAEASARATAAERERCARWQPIETAPVGKDVLLYCPARGLTNEERIELGWADSGRGSHHAWATHWMPLPDGPSAAAHRAGERE